MALCSADDLVRYAGLADPDWDLLDALAERASAAVEDYCRRRFAVEDRDERHDVANGMDTVVLRHYPVREMTALYDGVGAGSTVRLVGAAEYVLDADAGTVQLASGYFAPGRGAVRAVYKAGYDRVPAAVAQATVMLAADWYRNRPDGRVLAEGYDGYRAQYATGALPPAVAELLAPYRRRDLA
jgi:uncharacterized phiE125 gp8 family phage protein